MVLYSKLADWDDDDVSALPDTTSRWERVVILKHMFTQKEIEVRRAYPFDRISRANCCL